MKRPIPAARRPVVRTAELRYQPPLDWQALLSFFAARAVTGVEHVQGARYARTIEVDSRAGWIEVASDESRGSLRLRIALDGRAETAGVARRVRRLFDLDADPAAIAAHLGRDRRLARFLAARPGLRVPGAWDGFEIAVRAVLGQQISVRGATTLAGRLVARFGVPLATPIPGLTHLFPAPRALAGAELEAIGLPRARAATLRALARGFAAGELGLDPRREPSAALALLEAVPGIGPWTLRYLALRALGDRDAFPAGDLGVRRALGNGRGPLSEKAAENASRPWRPYRAYATLHLWQSFADRQTP